MCKPLFRDAIVGSDNLEQADSVEHPSLAKLEEKKTLFINVYVPKKTSLSTEHKWSRSRVYQGSCWVFQISRLFQIIRPLPAYSEEVGFWSSAELLAAEVLAVPAAAAAADAAGADVLDCAVVTGVKNASSFCSRLSVRTI
jgi:hypothetical protein